jgi:predicted transcriptional regulator of viral defense system
MLKEKALVSYMKNFSFHHGYVHMSDLKKNGFHTSEIKNLLDTGELEKVKTGLYRIVDFPDIKNVSISFIDVSHAIKKGVICLLSALDYHNLTTFNPSEIYIAIPRDSKAPKINYPPVQFFYFSEKNYTLGIEEVTTKYGTVRIYDKEKSLCDIFRYRDKLGEDLALEALKMYLKTKDFNIHKLLEYAEICRVRKILSDYIKVIIS